MKRLLLIIIPFLIQSCSFLDQNQPISKKEEFATVSFERAYINGPVLDTSSYFFSIKKGSDTTWMTYRNPKDSLIDPYFSLYILHNQVHCVNGAKWTLFHKSGDTLLYKPLMEDRGQTLLIHPEEGIIEYYGRHGGIRSTKIELTP